MKKQTRNRLLLATASIALGFTTLSAETTDLKFAGWYMRTKVTATAPDGTVYRHETAGVFGKLKQSVYGKDLHDLPAGGPSAFQVVFPHNNWGDKSGDYWTDYRKWTKVKKKTVWKFQIKNQRSIDLSNAPITIELDGKQNVGFTEDENGRIRYTEKKLQLWQRKNFTLVDVDNKWKKYRYDELENADLNMDGKHTRTFKWIYEPK